jgi:hypothetical protein
MVETAAEEAERGPLERPAALLELEQQIKAGMAVQLDSM